MTFLLALTLSFPTFAKCDKRLVYSFLNTKPGYQIDQNGKKSGSSYRVLTEISRRMGCPRTEEPTSYSAARENFKNRRVDIFGLSPRENLLDEVGDFIEVYRVPRSLIVRKKLFRVKDPIQSVVNNPNIKFAGIISGRFFICAEEKEKLFKSGRLTEYPSPEEIFKALLNGRVDATFSSPIFTHYYLTTLAKDRVDEFQIIPDETFMDSVGFYASKARLTQAERDSLKTITKEMKQDGTLLQIESDYVDSKDYKYYSP